VGNEKNLFTNKTISKNLSKNYFCVIKELKTGVVKVTQNLNIQINLPFQKVGNLLN